MFRAGAISVIMNKMKLVDRIYTKMSELRFEGLNDLYDYG